MNFCNQCKYAKTYYAGDKEYIFCKRIYDNMRPGIPGYTYSGTTTKRIDAIACTKFEPKTKEE